MLNDDTKVVAYEFSYRSAGGYPVNTLVLYGYEYDGNTADEMLEEAVNSGEKNCRIMTYAEFIEEDRKLTLAIGVHEVDEETFDEMLNVLPPLKWCDRVCEKHRARVNEFCMSEFDHGPYTQQYARAYVNGKTRYYSATVDYFDESTWIHNRL